MAKPAADVPLPEIQAVIDNFGAAAIRWTKKAQRAAVIDWRDRRAAPGVHVRFLAAGHDAYGFSSRSPRYQRRKGAKTPDYVNTGAFRESLLKRKPKTSQQGADILTRFSLMGGAINFLAGKRGSVRTVEQVKAEAVNVRPHTRKGHAVSGYTQTRRELRVTRTPSGRTYAQEFQMQFQDQAYLNTQTENRLLEIVRKAAFKKNGQIRESFRDEMRLGLLVSA